MFMNCVLTCCFNMLFRKMFNNTVVFEKSSVKLGWSPDGLEETHGPPKPQELLSNLVVAGRNRSKNRVGKLVGWKVEIWRDVGQKKIWEKVVVPKLEDPWYRLISRKIKKLWYKQNNCEKSETVILQNKQLQNCDTKNKLFDYLIDSVLFYNQKNQEKQLPKVPSDFGIVVVWDPSLAPAQRPCT